jgi:sulfotransferase family protein
VGGDNGESAAVITIVSGLPRTGTSLMMQMLAAGGMTLLTDFERKPDEDNPRGYCEWEPAKLLPKQPELIDEAEGKAVKIISQLLMSIPAGRNYKIIFMQRSLAEVLASQDEMLRRRGSSDLVEHDLMASAFEKHLEEAKAWLKKKDIPVCFLRYKNLVNDPMGSARTVRDFLSLDLNLNAMAQQADMSLYRNRQ